MPAESARKPAQKVPPRKLPALADYSDEVTDEHLKRIADLVPEKEYEKAEEVCEPGW